MEKITEINLFQVKKRSFDQFKVSRLPIRKGQCHLCMVGQLKLYTYCSPFKNNKELNLTLPD